MKQIVLGLVILALVASTGFAHGGAYRGPAGEVPPNMRKPEDPPPPNEGGTPTPPPEENPGTPTPPDNPNGARPAPAPPGASNPDGGAGAVAPRAPGANNGGSGATTGNPRGKSSGAPPVTYESWAFWWGYNKDDILNLKARLKAGEGTSGTEEGLLNVGETIVREKSTGTQGITDSRIREAVIPALEKILDDLDANFDIRAGAVIALGKIGASQPEVAGKIAHRLIDIMNNKSGKEHFSVEESGALALGLLQLKDPENVVLNALCDKALDRRGQTKNQRTRAFACLALGLLQVDPTDGDEIYQRVRSTLVEIVKSPKESLDDMAVCALTAMGLSGDASFAPDLLAIVKEGKAYKTKKLKDLVQCYAASAVGKLAETNPGVATREAVEVFKKAMTTEGVNTMRSSVIAFGQLGSQPDVDEKLVQQMVYSLEYMVKKGEAQSANFALISLGKIGGAVADGSLRNKIFVTLKTAMKKGTYSSKPFAALALGLMGRTQTNADSRDAFREAVRFEFNEYKGDPKNQGAYAIALGMLEDRESSPALIKILEDRGAVKDLRGSCAIALGLIKDMAARKAIMSALEEPEDRDLRVDTAVAAGLLGDSGAIKVLAEILNDDKSSLFVQGSVSLALGRIGDHRAVEPLVSLLQDEKGQDLNRALAAVALGLLGDRLDLPTLSRLSKDVNYRATINSMDEVLSIL